ncbi:uncharacterized protein METZ01_LOCUS42041 [marine metagenome]|uniref:Cytochrome c-type biogenesis protein CcmE n=1 Tax=marine metagenome TaxID=408172 RepID=A0A381RH30_9ZZZZ|tara:strand:+ start:956 stop:1411 length:456 start_codon:yes stop_codon:yes gene_type:complete
MKPRNQRILAFALVALGIIVAATLTFRAFQENMMFFIGISDVVNEKNIPFNRDFRVGGLVVDKSVSRESDTLNVTFILTDNFNTLEVHYQGILPDLFREGQGIIAHGRLNNLGVFEAKTVLAKHDENYMPPEVAESLKEHVIEKTSITDST